jgi:hypothetical protein
VLISLPTEWFSKIARVSLLLAGNSHQILANPFRDSAMHSALATAILARLMPIYESKTINRH